MRVLLFVITFLIIVACSGRSTEYVTARIIDVSFTVSPKIIVAYGDTEQEIIELHTYENPMMHMGTSNMKSVWDDPIAKNLKIINGFLNSMEKKGYEIVEMSTSVHTGHFTFIIFRK